MSNQQNDKQICLEVKNLSKTYPVVHTIFHKGKRAEPVQALRNVSFALGPGLYGLLGPNGAGKSTLISIITTSLQQDVGRIEWKGKDIRALGIAYRRDLGYMPQQQTLYPSYTGRRFLLYIAALKEIPKGRMKDEIDSAAANVGLANELGKRLSAYSGGMKQRLLAAASMLGAPQLLVMDEPTAGLDPRERVRLRNQLARYAQNNVVLVATHVVSDVETAASQILLLKKGQLVDMGRPHKLIEKHAPGKNMEQVYLAVFGAEDDV